MKITLAAAAALTAALALPAAAQTSRTRTTTTTTGGYTAVTVHQDAPQLAYPPVDRYEPRPAPRIDYAPVPLDVNVFDGLRAEAQIGFDRIQDRDGDFFSGDGNGSNGLVYGGEVGADLALGSRAILGIYGGIEGSTIDQCQTDAGTTLCVKPNRSLMAGARLGVAVGPETLLYVKGGYTSARLDFGARAAGTAGGLAFDGDADGFHVGGGVEANLSRHAYGKLEYVYTRLGNLRVDGLTGSVDAKFDRHQVKAGLGLRM